MTRHQHYKQILFDYSPPQENFGKVQSAKYLGITISDNMDWGQHISEISSKATKTLGILLRNLAFATTSTKEVAYKTLVRPKLEYAAPFWSPYSKPQIDQVEKVQRTAAHWTCQRLRNTGALKNFFLRTIPQWNSFSPSVVNSQTTEEFRALLN